MKPQILIAEDEPLMRERLQELLQRVWPQAAIVAIAENGPDTWDAFLEHEPSVVFLDIRMPGMNGLELARKIGRQAHVVFITAYDQYAVEAFEAGSVDYLLKPVEEQRLAMAVERLKDKLSSAPPDIQMLLRSLQSASAPAPALPAMKWIKATVGKQIRLINVADVLFFQSDTKYTRVVLADSEALIRTPIKDLLSSLDPEQFWQIHRSFMVNVHQIAAAERVDAERMQLILKDHSEKLPVSRNFTHLFRE